MAKKSKAIAWLEYGLARSALGIVAALPARLGDRVAMGITALLAALLPAFRKTASRNLEIAFPERSVAERDEIRRSAVRNLGRVLSTSSRMFGASADAVREMIVYDPTPEFAAAYQKSIDDGRGRIILGGHIGNWELQAFSYPLLLEPLAFLARRMDNPLLESYTRAMRTRLGNTQIDKENSARTILSTLRAGGAVGVLADVNSHPKEGVFVPFFGVEACTASGVAMLAIRANAVIVPMWAIWDKELCQYRIVHDEIIEPVRTGDRQADIVTTTAMYVSATERVIRKYPDQWIWVHRRWKTRPPGEPSLY
jgi:KDO2-lipid IV(A) lauroyltransferase